MPVPGETVGFDGVICDCGQELKLDVCRSAAGHYLGYFCPNCGPYSRETGYYASRQEAEWELAMTNGGGMPRKAR